MERIRRWREVCPEIAIRSTFIVGFPGETDEDVGMLLDFLEEAQLDRAGCFTYSAVQGAPANGLADHVDEADKLDRQERVYETQSQISAARLDRFVGQRLRVLVDEAGPQPVARTAWDAPEIDGIVHLQPSLELRAGEFAWVEIQHRDDHDLYGIYAGRGLELS